jgi:predicted O-methyltransferase YrrM
MSVSPLRDHIPDRVKHLHADVGHLSRWRRLPVARPTRRFVRHHGLRVQAGPFAGMTYPRSAIGRADQLVAKLLGAYESELHDALERLARMDWERIVDIGAGDGYYAVGLALRCPTARVEAWEMNPLPARVCAELAHANGVAARVEIRGECRAEDLHALPEGRTLVFSDCEGAEDRLLDPDGVPALRKSTLVVEIHEALVPGVEQRLVERFAPTHEVETLTVERRFAGEHTALSEVEGLNYMDQEILLTEFRTLPVKWAVMTPRGAPA